MNLRTLHQIHLDRGDSIASEAHITYPTLGEILFEDEEHPKLIAIWWGWEVSKKERFSRLYGRIGESLGKVVDKYFIRALIQFWDPAFHCFTFGQSDICPTLEDFGNILCTDPRYNCFPYSRQTFKLLEHIMGKRQVKIGNVMHKLGLPLAYLVQALEVGMEEIHEFRTMALAIYRIIIFPKTHGLIDRSVFPFVDALEIEDPIDPIPVILAEMIRSLDECRHNGGGLFKGCPHLLFIWGRSHFKGMDLITRRYSKRNPAANFYGANCRNSRTLEEWLELLTQQGDEELIWRPNWLGSECKFLYRCGDYSWVPLLGIFGGTGYTPGVFLQQFDCPFPSVAATEGLFESNFYYTDAARAKVECKRIIEAWEQPRRIVLKGKEQEILTFDALPYFEWRKKRGSGLTVPNLLTKDVPSDVQFLKKRILDLEGLNRYLTTKIQSLGVDAIYWKNMCANPGTRKLKGRESEEEVLRERDELREQDKKQKAEIEYLKEILAYGESTSEHCCELNKMYQEKEIRAFEEKKKNC